MIPLDVELIGTSPLLMNSNRGVNPMEEDVIELKKYTSKRKRSDEDEFKILLLKWKLSLYYNEEIGPYVPAENIEASLRDAAKRSRRGKDAVIGLRVVQSEIPLIYDGPRDIKALSEDRRFMDVRVGRIRGASIMLARARFTRWRLAFRLEYDENVFNADEVEELFDVAGQYIGLCDYRPRYGGFEASISPA